MIHKTRIVLTGGGSGGHTYPLLAVAEALQKISNEKALVVELYYLGSRDQWSDALAMRDIKIKTIVAGKIRRYFSFRNFFDIPLIFLGIFQALWKLFWLMPDVIFSKGGTGAFPVVFAGWFYRIPVVIHESDATPGLTNLASSFFAKRIVLNFESAERYFKQEKTTVSGNPVRSDLLRDLTTPERAKQEFNFDSQKPLLLILGGSQGAQRINEFIVVLLKDLIPMTQVLHQTGIANFLEIKKLTQAAMFEVPLAKELQNRYEVSPYFEKNMSLALAAADLVVSRAGAGTIFELAAFGKPAILIPLRESANDHQRKNAYEFAKAGAAVVIEEPNLLPEIFLGQVRELLGDPAKLAQMAAASQKFFSAHGGSASGGKPGAAEAIAEEILKLVR